MPDRSLLDPAAEPDAVDQPPPVDEPAAMLPPSRLRLAASAALMLFLQLALIRWTGANVVFVSYFSNLVLLGSFLGIGIGFLRARSRRSLVPYVPPLLGGYVLLMSLLPVEVRAEEDGLIFFGGNATGVALSGMPIWVTLPIVFIAVTAVMSGIGELVGRAFAPFRPLDAYRLDILGSLAGIAGFTLLSLLHAPPIAWGIVVAALLLWLVVLPRAETFDTSLRPNSRRVLVAQLLMVGALLAALTVESTTDRTRWSPYYEVTWRDISSSTGGEPGWGVQVNGLPHQAIVSTDVRREAEPFYVQPHEWRAAGPLDDVLIVGAGNGSDVAIALEEGARRVDAVEIDPVLIDLGRRLHPNEPYDDPRVHEHVTDGRAFIERTDRRYDLVIFALPDSLTLVSGQNSLRLESYLFTEQSFEAVRDLLKDDGTFAMYNYYRSPWLVDRLAGTLDEVFGHAPCVQTGGGAMAVLAVTREPGAERCDADRVWERPSGTPDPSTDDRPFLYLREPSIPNLYVATLSLVLLMSIVLVRVAAGGVQPIFRYGDLFLMGAAFLLLETKSVVQFALLFGTTWIVNAIVFAAILVAVLLAIEVSARWRPRRPALLWAALAAAIAVAWATPLDLLLQLGTVPRIVVAGTLAFLPVFLANVLFAQRFRDTASSTHAFGANLLGAMVGGVLEYASLVTGYRSLLVVVLLLYVGAFLLQRRLNPATTVMSTPAS